MKLTPEMIKLQDKIMDLCREAKPAFLLRVAPIYSIAECALYDLWGMLKDNKAKGIWRMCVRESYKYTKSSGIDKWANCGQLVGYDLYLDVSDVMQEKSRPYATMLRVALNNVVINATDKDKVLKTQLLYVKHLYKCAMKAYDNFFEELKKVCHFDVSECFSVAKYQCVYDRMEKACRDFCGDIESNNLSIVNAENSLINIFKSYNFINGSAKEGMEVNGNYESALREVDESAKDALKERLQEKYKVV